MSPNGHSMLEWRWTRRFRFFALWGLGFAAITIGFALLTSDLDRGLTFSKFSPTGTVPLWPTVTRFAVLSVMGPLVLATSLPLYRYRRGGYVVGLVGSSVTLGIAALAGYLINPVREAEASGDWTNLAVTVLLLALMTWAGGQARPLVVGEPDNEGAERSRPAT